MPSNEYTDSELREILKRYGKDCGPINDCTRSVYLNLLNDLMKENENSNSNKTNSQSSTKSIFKEGEFTPTNFNKSKTRAKENNGNISESARSSFSLMDSIFQKNKSNNNKKYDYDNNDGNLVNWYRGPLPKMSSNNMDLSDIDSSDTEKDTLVTKLRQNYLKTIHTDSESKSRKSWNIWPSLSLIKSENLPTIMLSIFLISIVVLFLSYVALRQKHSTINLDLSFRKFICLDEESTSNKRCVEEKQIKTYKIYLANLFDILSEHSGEQICNFNPIENCRMPYDKAKNLLTMKLNRYKEVEITTEEWNQLLVMILSFPGDSLPVIAYSANGHKLDVTNNPEEVSYLESLRPRCSLLCRFKLLIGNLISWICYFIIVSLCVGLISGFVYFLYHLRMKKHERYLNKIREFHEIITSISCILQDQLTQSESASNVDPYIPIHTLRTMVQQDYPKVRDQKFWEEFKQYMYSSEPSIELKDKVLQGEVLQWRGRPTWQGSALQMNNVKEFTKAPTECLKIRNIEIRRHCDDREDYVKRELLNRISDAGHIKHIGIVHKGNKMIAYIMCGDCFVSARAFKKINVNYFNGNLLSVKFVRLEKYLERFPDSNNNANIDTNHE